MSRLTSVVVAGSICLLLFACDDVSKPGVEPMVEPVAEIAKTSQNEDVMGKWARSCALCHATGVGGAPRAGNLEEWQPRIAKGNQILLDHTVNGFNNMPPLGYCMSCEEDDFIALIDFMSGDSP